VPDKASSKYDKFLLLDNELISVSTKDFPREVEERKKSLESYKKLKELISVKDEIIWSLVVKNKSKKTENLLANNFHIEPRLNLICHFCGINLDENSVNSVCPKNLDIRDQKGSYTNVIISQEYLNNKRHYFANSKEREKDTMIIGKSNKNIDENISEDYIIKVFHKMIKNGIKNNVDLENMITINFKIINSVKGIRPILISKFELSEQEANSILTFFCFDTKNNSSENSPLNLNGMFNFLQKAAKTVKGPNNQTVNPFENNILNEQKHGSNTRYTNNSGGIDIYNILRFS